MSVLDAIGAHVGGDKHDCAPHAKARAKEIKHGLLIVALAYKRPEHIVVGTCHVKCATHWSHELRINRILGADLEGLGRAADDKKIIREQASKKMKVRISKEAYVDIECGYPTTEGDSTPRARSMGSTTEGGCGEAVPDS